MDSFQEWYFYCEVFVIACCWKPMRGSSLEIWFGICAFLLKSIFIFIFYVGSLVGKGSNYGSIKDKGKTSSQ